MSTMTFYRTTDDGPEEKLGYYTVCRDCGWEDSETHSDQADCCVSECPECGSDHIEDLEEYV